MARPKRNNSAGSDPSSRPKKTPISPQNRRKQARSLPPASSVHDEANNTARASADASQRAGSPAEELGAGSSSGRSGGPPRWNKETTLPVEVVSRYDRQSIDGKKRRERGRGFLRGEATTDVPPAASPATIADITTEIASDAESHPPRTTLVSLPNEILLQIASRLRERDLNSLSLINFRLYLLLTHLLYRLGKEIEYLDLSTLLHWACTRGLTNTVHHLLEQSANPNAKYHRAYHPLQSDGRTPLHICAETGNRRIAKLLLAHGAKTKTWDKEGNSPLHLAVKHGKRGMVKVLVRSGAKITARNTDGLRPLHVAILEDQKHLVKLLIDLGADVNAKDRTYGTALHLAASFESSGICEKLIQAGADVNGRDLIGMTPLHWAAYTGYVQTARLLVKQGARIDERDNDGKLPLHWAGIGSNKEVWNYLSVLVTSVGQLKDNNGLVPELKSKETSTIGDATDASDSEEEENEVL